MRNYSGYRGRRRANGGADVLMPLVAAVVAAAVCCMLYYMMEITPEYVAILCGVVFLGGLLSLLVHGNYDSLLWYLVFVLALGAIGYVLMFHVLFRWLPSDPGVPFLGIPCLVVVAVLGVLVRVVTRDVRFENFRRFFLVTNLALGALYAWGFVWTLLLRNEWYSPITDSMQWIPFARLSELIEDVIMGIGEPKDVIWYVAARILIYVPYGYYCAVLLRDGLVLLRFPFVIVLPVVIELVQRVFSLGGTDIDDVILGIIGGIFGVLVYCIIDGCRRAFIGRGLLERESSY